MLVVPFLLSYRSDFFRWTFSTTTNSHLETSHHHRHNHVTFLIGHLVADTQQHQHVVAVCDAHRVQVTQDISTCNLALVNVFIV